jgi:hypothetical protein
VVSSSFGSGVVQVEGEREERVWSRERERECKRERRCWKWERATDELPDRGTGKYCTLRAAPVHGNREVRATDELPERGTGKYCTCSGLLQCTGSGRYGKFGVWRRKRRRRSGYSAPVL